MTRPCIYASLSVDCPPELVVLDSLLLPKQLPGWSLEECQWQTDNGQNEDGECGADRGTIEVMRGGLDTKSCGGMGECNHWPVTTDQRTARARPGGPPAPS